MENCIGFASKLSSAADFKLQMSILQTFSLKFWITLHLCEINHFIYNNLTLPVTSLRYLMNFFNYFSIILMKSYNLSIICNRSFFPSGRDLKRFQEIEE